MSLTHGRAVRFLRRGGPPLADAAGLSQEQLGQLIGYSAALVGRVELGERSPSLDFAAGCDRALPDGGRPVRAAV